MDASEKQAFSDGLFNRSHGSFELVLAPVMLGFVGFWLDGLLDIRPALTIVLAFFGLVGVAAKLYYGFKADTAALARMRAAAAERARAERAPADLTRVALAEADLAPAEWAEADLAPAEWAPSDRTPMSHRTAATGW
jgi:hypothetical protein